MASNNINANRIAKNTLMLYVRTFVILLITLYTSRVVLKVLGVEDYGTYNVVAGAVAFFNFLNHAMSMATQRFLNVEMVKNDTASLRRVFCMAMNLHIIIGLIVVILSESIGLWLVNGVLNIPEGRMVAANWVFQFVVLGMFFKIIMVPYNSVIIAQERMSIYAYISILEVVLQLGLVFALNWFKADKLILYGGLMFGVTLCVFLIYKFYVNAKFKESKYYLLWDRGLFQKMAGFLGWNVLGQLAQIFTTQGVNMVVNVFYGVVLNAAMSIQHQVSAGITMFVHNFQTSFRPQITKSYAANEIPEMKSLVMKASKMSFYLLYLISVPIIFNIDLILDIWLDTVPDHTAAFCKLAIWFSYLEAIGMPLVMSIMASGKNRDYQIFFSISVSLNLLLVWLFFKMGFPPETVFYIKIVLGALTLFVRMFFAKRQAYIPLLSFLKGAILPCLIVLGITQSIIFLLLRVYDGSIWHKAGLTAFLEIIIAVVILFIGMNKSERVFIKNSITKFITKTKHKR